MQQFTYYALGRDDDYNVYEHHERLEEEETTPSSGRKQNMDRELFPGISLSRNRAYRIAELLMSSESTGLLECGACKIQRTGKDIWSIWAHGRFVGTEACCSDAFAVVQRHHASALPLEMLVLDRLKLVSLACEHVWWFGLRKCRRGAYARCARCATFVCREHGDFDAQGDFVCRPCLRLFAPEALVKVIPVAVTLKRTLTNELCLLCRKPLYKCPHCAGLYCLQCGLPEDEACKEAFASEALQEVVAHQLTRRFEEK